MHAFDLLAKLNVFLSAYMALTRKGLNLEWNLSSGTFTFLRSDNVSQHHIIPAKDLLRGIKCHGEAGHEEVSEGEADQEVVVDTAQLPVEEDAGDDKEVGENGHEDDEDKDDCLADVEERDMEVFAIQVLGDVREVGVSVGDGG